MIHAVTALIAPWITSAVSEKQAAVVYLEQDFPHGTLRYLE